MHRSLTRNPSRDGKEVCHLPVAMHHRCVTVSVLADRRKVDACVCQSSRRRLTATARQDDLYGRLDPEYRRVPSSRGHDLESPRPNFRLDQNVSGGGELPSRRTMVEGRHVV